MNDCLVLDSSNRPIGFSDWQTAVKLYWEDVVDIVKEDQNGRVLRSPSLEMPFPRVVRVKGYTAKRFRKHLPPHRYNVAVRDGYMCQYCGEILTASDSWTVDHVIPRSRGGQNTWTNLVLACGPCNRRKGNRTPEEAGMALITIPVEPKAKFFQPNRRMRPEWQDWVQ